MTETTPIASNPTPITGISFLRLIKKHISRGDTGSMLVGHPNSRMQALWDAQLLGIQAYSEGYFHIWITAKGEQVLEAAEKSDLVVDDTQNQAESVVNSPVSLSEALNTDLEHLHTLRL